jgi:Bardet-Biedl syndrome 9 protein
VDASLTHLLRTCLSRSAKEQPMNPGPLSMPTDATKLQKHIALVCDRLSKGSRPASDTASAKGRSIALLVFVIYILAYKCQSH